MREVMRSWRQITLRLSPSASSSWTVACLARVRSAKRCPVAGYDLYPGPLREPSDRTGSLPVGQQVHRTPAFHLDQDSPVATPFAVAYSSTPTTRGTGTSGSGKAATSRSSVPRLTDTPKTLAMRDPARPASARPTAASRPQALGPPAVPTAQPRRLPSEGPACAGDDQAEKPADPQAEDDPSATAGHISWKLQVGAVNPPRPAPRSPGNRTRPPYFGLRCVPPRCSRRPTTQPRPRSGGTVSLFQPDGWFSRDEGAKPLEPPRSVIRRVRKPVFRRRSPPRRRRCQVLLLSDSWPPSGWNGAGARARVPQSARPGRPGCSGRTSRHRARYLADRTLVRAVPLPRLVPHRRRVIDHVVRAPQPGCDKTPGQCSPAVLGRGL